ncbi:MAG: TonB-dependent receptor [Candidatus Coatesbacteria bacterium]|nr:TonB-dependent receptor [Candidatus Coatesbacteria bacterium]
MKPSWMAGAALLASILFATSAFAGGVGWAFQPAPGICIGKHQDRCNCAPVGAGLVSARSIGYGEPRSSGGDKPRSYTFDDAIGNGVGWAFQPAQNPSAQSTSESQPNASSKGGESAPANDKSSTKKSEEKPEKQEAGNDEEVAIERELVVTATRTETDSSNVSAAITVVRPEDQPKKPKTAADMLGAVPGLKFNRYGGGMSLAAPSIRGSEGNQVLVIIDGIRLNSARGDGVDLSDVPASIIDRIEIVRGGSSALYGSDAMGGVINIITKKGAKRRETSLSLTGGSFGTYSGSLSRFESFDNRLDYSVSLSYGESEGDFPYEFRGSKIKRIGNGGYRTRGGFLRTNYGIGANSSIGLTHIFNDAVKRQPGRIEFPTPDAEQDNRWNLTTLTLDRGKLLIPGLKSTLTVHYRSDSMSYYDPIFVGEEPSGYKGHSLGAELMLSYSLGTHQFFTFSAGAGDERQDSISSGLHSRTTTSLFAQDLISLFDDRIILIPAARLDRYSDIGHSFNPKIGLCLKPVPFLRFKANASRSFRVPGFDDLYWPRSGFAVGNPDIDPETCRSYDAGFELDIDQMLSVEFVCFLNEAEDLIQWQPGQGGVWSPTNVSEAEMKGVEARLIASPLKYFRLEVLHTYLDAKDTTDPERETQLIRRPQNKTTATLNLGPKWLSGSARIARTSESYTTAANTKYLPAYTLIDCGLRTSPFDWLSISLSAENITDRSYETVPGYAMPGRSYSLTIETTLGGR